jgi:hypothetical protein
MRTLLGDETPSIIPTLEVSTKRRRKIFGGNISDGIEALPPVIEKLMLYVETYRKRFFLKFFSQI